MSKKKSGHSGCCPDCDTLSHLVKNYRTRSVQHYRVGGMELLELASITYRCVNESCSRKNFTIVSAEAGGEVVIGKSRYTQSSKVFVAQKMLKRATSYHSFCTEIKEDFGGNTAFSTLHRWTQEMKVVNAPIDLTEMAVLHTDEKHPSKKKENQTKNL
jgi:hypothetical protein